MRLIDSEIFKLRTTRTFYVMTAVTLGLILVIVTLVMALVDFEPDDQPLLDLVSVGFLIQAITLILGVLIVTSEFRHGTITPTLLVAPDRIRLTLAKLAAGLIVGVAIGLLTSLLIAGVVALIGTIRDVDIGADGGDLLSVVVGGAAAAALFAGIGVGIGAVVRNQVGAIIGVLVWLFVLEGIIGLIPKVDDIVPKYGLNGARAGLSGEGDQGAELLGQLPAGLVLAGYVVVFVGIGLVLMRRRDVTA